ncbi:HNH endonuclease [Vibrio kasasachensis]|uniref:GmrSD restriction endonuclease domain-containing protein n=1 Tax=Vibrio kasasachensis TaxID=2910248 RepID=UPI003D11DD6D
MAAKSNFVNLDAMIKRADFAHTQDEASSFETFNSIPARELASGSPIVALLRKPDFQRETNHWTPEQVVSLLECYINGDLIPSVILWMSPSFLFVIDGGHRLSVIRAWMEDDYGDGQISHKLFGHNISNEQKKAAEKTRKLVKERIGTWTYYKSLLSDNDNDDITAKQRKILATLTARGLQVQWVKGDTDKAEASFFNINMKGTPLDGIEELLLRNRKKPVPIAARAVIRAGKGHRYWSSFEESNAEKIESMSLKLHQLLFDPEIKKPVKTLDLPLSGSKGIRTAIQILIEFILISDTKQQSVRKKIDKYEDDTDGSKTIEVLSNAIRLASRITGNDRGSLGLHPAIYFYGPTGRHSSMMFLGAISLFSDKLANNNKDFFYKFTEVRATLEDILIEHKDLIATIIHKHISHKRAKIFQDLLEESINALSEGRLISQETLIKFAKLDGKLITGVIENNKSKISDDQKSKLFINVALKNAIKCPECSGFLDIDKSVSYDHILRVRDGGNGSAENIQLTHPFCNQSVKQ